MADLDQIIRTVSGVPVERDFQAIVASDGRFVWRSIVINSATGTPYVRRDDGVIVAMNIGTSMAIKSIQRGTISLGAAASATATITAVDTTKTELRNLGVSCAAATGTDNAYVKLVLTNTTTITASRIGNSNTTTIVSWELTEYV